MLRFSKALLLIISNAQSSAQILRCFDTKMLKCFHIHPFAEPFEDSWQQGEWRVGEDHY